MYRIEFVTSAAKEFRALDQNHKRRIGSTIDRLSENPRPHQSRKLTGQENLYRVRVGVYRVIYEIYDDELLVKVMRIRHRKDAYR